MSLCWLTPVACETIWQLQEKPMPCLLFHHSVVCSVLNALDMWITLSKVVLCCTILCKTLINIITWKRVRAHSLIIQTKASLLMPFAQQYRIWPLLRDVVCVVQGQNLRCVRSGHFLPQYGICWIIVDVQSRKMIFFMSRCLLIVMGSLKTSKKLYRQKHFQHTHITTPWKKLYRCFRAHVIFMTVTQPKRIEV